MNKPTWQERFDGYFKEVVAMSHPYVLGSSRQIKHFISQELKKVEKECAEALTQMRDAFDSGLEKARTEGIEQGKEEMWAKVTTNGVYMLALKKEREEERNKILKIVEEFGKDKYGFETTLQELIKRIQ